MKGWLRAVKANPEALVFYLLAAVLLGVLLHRMQSLDAPAASPECAGTTAVAPGSPTPLADAPADDRFLIAVYTNSCPACQDDARDLVAPASDRLWAGGLVVYVVLVGADSPAGYVKQLLSHRNVYTIVDPDAEYVSRWDLPGAPYYFFSDSGRVKWCQKGRVVVDGKSNSLLDRLKREVD